jgi:pteridine reductase
MPEAQRVALVTGGAKRVGRAIVERLADAGFAVAFTYLNSEGDARQLERQTSARGGTVRAIRADLLELPAGVDVIERDFRASFPRLDLLVNNASLYEPGDLASADLALIRRMFTIHVEGPLLLCQRFAGDLRASGGHVVNMIDLLAERPWPKFLAYSASKAALANLTLGLSRELAPEVTVNGIAPGVVEWPDDLPESEREKYLKRVPLGRAGSPKDVAEAVLYLCTTGSYVTGQILRVDGGRSVT